jgi:hypothetical protein
MIRKSTRLGAARVSIIWLITMVVLFFVALGFGYLGFTEAATAEDRAQKALQAEAAADDRQAEDAQHIIALSQATGFYDAAAATPRSKADAITAALDDLKGTFPDMGPEITTLEQALPILKQAYAKRGQEITTLTDARDTLASEKTTMDEQLREVIAGKDEEIKTLQGQIADDSANAAQKQTELENRVASLNTQRNDLDAQTRQLRGQIEELQRQHEAERQTWETRTRAVTETLAFLEEPDRPDGKVLAVSKDLSLGWIDIGAGQRLARGTSFTVVSGTTGSSATKAMATVTRVEADRAEVVFHNVTDQFDPVVAGDVIYNPLYDPTGVRHAVLAGRFSGQFNEAKLKVLLKDIGITVQETLDFNTDYLIVGSELFTDEDGNPLEDPLSPAELPVYKDAEANGVQIVSIKDLHGYFVM